MQLEENEFIYKKRKRNKHNFSWHVEARLGMARQKKDPIKTRDKTRPRAAHGLKATNDEPTWTEGDKGWINTRAGEHS